jgi:hypothetical protein
MLPILRKKIYDFAFDESGNVNRMNLALLVVVIFAFTLCFLIIAKYVKAMEGGEDDSSGGAPDSSGGAPDSSGGPSSGGPSSGGSPPETRADSGEGGDDSGDTGGSPTQILGHLFQTTLVYNQFQIIATSRMIR